MSFERVLDQAIEMLRRRGCLTYLALKRQFDLDDAYFEDLKEELIKGQQLARDENEEVLVWVGADESKPFSDDPDQQADTQEATSTPIIRAGLGIVDAMGPFNSRLAHDKGVCLAVRIGIHTGPVVIGDIGLGASQEQLALGETPNIAARLQGFAEANAVVLSSAVHRLVQGYFECDDLGEPELRGVAEPLSVYRVVRESGAQ
ncbi:MAG: adenylate/guanylate cyclase domain-containing protein, partial [Candidatus Tectomicrobia bacterium]|nr:adenylate/guanylate cyclase domain-containing protein [Candidatus Tectomicrobia bacterium]